MFNLVGKRYLFLIISLIVIVPGTISLIFRGLNLGIDFAGGANIELRPRADLTTAQIQNLVKPLKLASLQIVTGDNPSLPANQTIWVRLNTRIDIVVQKAIQNTLQNGRTDGKNQLKGYGSQLAVTFDDLSLNPLSGRPPIVTVVTITKFLPGVAPKTGDIQALLASLPKTSDPTKGPPTTASPTPTVSPTASATAKATPKTSPTATPGGTSTPVVGVTPTVTPTTTNTNPAKTTVTVDGVYQGSTTHTFTLETLSEVGQASLLQLKADLINNGNNYVYVLDDAVVSASVASETTRNAFLAVLAASVFILLYVWFAFRKVTKPWRYGTCAIIALLHDVLVVLGVFSILGWLVHFQIDALFITALLTVVGFSVHDTIVVFDRIRENMTRRTSETFEQVVNASLVQTMARSLNTSLTVLFTLSALTLFGGTTIRGFTLTLLVGIFSGTYSSIFNASMLLVIWERGELGTNRLSRDRTPTRRETRELARTRG